MISFRESTLGGSEIFSGINSMDSDQTVINRAVNLIKTGRKLTNEDIETAYISVRQISDTLTREAIKAFDEERVQLIYNQNPALSVSQALPFISYRRKNGPVGYIFVDKYISVSRDNVMNISAPVLRDLLTAGMISAGLKNNYNKLQSNQLLQQILLDVYTKFFIRIINRLYSVASNKEVLETIQFFVSKYFLLNVFETLDDDDVVNSLCSEQLKYIDDLKFQEIKTQYSIANPKTISQLLELIKTTSPRMKTLGLGIFLSNWINYYYTPATLAIDTIEYLIFMTLTLLSGTNIVSITASDVVKESKNIKSFRGELLKII